MFNIELYLTVNIIGQGWGYKKPITRMTGESDMGVPWP